MTASLERAIEVIEEELLGRPGMDYVTCRYMILRLSAEIGRENRRRNEERAQHIVGFPSYEFTDEDKIA